MVSPSTPADAYGLMKTSIRSNNPVCFLENEMLYNFEAEVETGEQPDSIWCCRHQTRRADCTIVAIARCVHRALEAAEQLEAEGISCEIVDPRTIKPLDIDTIIKSVKKTNRLVVVEECHDQAVGSSPT